MTQSKITTIDFEFHSSNEEHPTLICAVMDEVKYWLANGSDKSILIRDIEAKKDHTFIAYYSVAEARCFLALGLNPMDYQWVDLYSEFRMLQNSNDEFEYGTYIPRTGIDKVKFSVRPIPGMEDIITDHSIVPSNYINASWKLLGERVDSERKDKMRDIILSKDINLIESNKEEILNYCLDDTKNLIPMLNKVFQYYLDNTPYGKERLRVQMKERGEYCAATARCEQLGIPIDIPFLKLIESKTQDIIKEERRRFNEEHFKYFEESYTPPPKTFKNGKVHIFKPVPPKKNTKAYQSYIESLQIKDFPKTDGGAFKSDKNTLEEYRFIPTCEALYQYGKLETSLKWFNNDNGSEFYEAVGKDEIVRPFYGVFGTQTSRNAAKAKTFPLAMSHWLRTIVKPKAGQYIISSDFSQQEIYVAAILSQDQNLLDAYLSGDVYLEFGKQAGLIPKNGTKKTHSKERQMCKATVLGLQFGMGKVKLQAKLSFELKEQVSLEKTEELVQAHKDTYSDYWQYVYSIRKDYQRGESLTLSDGWMLFSDNPSITSVGNFPVQGHAAAITRHAIVALWKKGIKVICGLHDAVYCSSTTPEKDLEIIEKQLIESTRIVLYEVKSNIRIDSKVYSSIDLFLEEKGEEDWNRLKKFFIDK